LEKAYLYEFTDDKIAEEMEQDTSSPMKELDTKWFAISLWNVQSSVKSTFKKPGKAGRRSDFFNS
jgi:hypothetical protein